MAIVGVYVRHSAKCPKSTVPGSGQYKRCNCPKWMRWGDNKRSAKTRSWEIASKKARLLEEELERGTLGLETPKKAEAISIEAATNLYLDDMTQRGKGTAKSRRMLQRLQQYANSQNVLLLNDVSARLLTEWRGKWTFKIKSSSPAVHWAVVRTFFVWAFATDLISVDPSAKIKCLPYVHNQVYPLSQEEMSRLLNATSECGFEVEVANRIRVFILLQRWSGLACMDAATLGRDRLSTNNNLTRVQRNKTGIQVFVPLPPPVCDALRCLPNDHPEYFFWNPNRMTKRSVVALFGELLVAVFNKADVPHGREEMLSHRFRHTFAVELLLAGVGIEEVSKLLGHKTIRTTERYYSAWGEKRQQKLEAEVKIAWTKMALPPLYATPAEGLIQ